MNDELKAAIKAAVLADQAPDIIDAIRVAIKEESDRLLHEWTKNNSYDKESKEEEAAVRNGSWKKWERLQRTPLWCWWQLFGHQLEYVGRSMRDDIAERSMTKGEIDDARKAEEVKRKREELARLEKASAE